MSNVLMYRYLQAKNWFQQEEGQDLVEYALIIVVVSVGLVAALGILRTDINAVFTKIGETLNP